MNRFTLSARRQGISYFVDLPHILDKIQTSAKPEQALMYWPLTDLDQHPLTVEERMTILGDTGIMIG